MDKGMDKGILVCPNCGAKGNFTLGAVTDVWYNVDAEGHVTGIAMKDLSEYIGHIASDWIYDAANPLMALKCNECEEWFEAESEGLYSNKIRFIIKE